VCSKARVYCVVNIYIYIFIYIYIYIFIYIVCDQYTLDVTTDIIARSV
jgi:hypothetical protein